MLGLIVAAEAIFGLPFHIARFFRPTLLAVLGFTDTELGVAMGIYGVVAMLAYFPGDPLADCFSARKLMTASLIATSLGGLYFATFPGVLGTQIVFAWWGATTILLFWAALIRATREWGGREEQGRAYGLLDGGRGLLAAVIGSAAVFLFAALLPEDPASATLAERTAALTRVV
jgi:MFS family permease